MLGVDVATSELLPAPVAGAGFTITASGAPMVVYVAGPTDGEPLLLLHSINAAASAYDVRPLFDFYRASRRGYAIDLPGFGLSDRSDRPYTVRLMTDAVHAVVNHIRGGVDGAPIDAFGRSLSCKFLARAAIETPDAFRSLALISPTGFEGKARDRAPGDRGKSWLLAALHGRWWRSVAFRASTRPWIIRAFLKKTWGSDSIDKGLFTYDCATVRQPGAEHAPFYFIAGYMFATDTLTIYETLNLPVWIVRGVRGDFVDYHHKTRVENKTNWTLEVLPSGAFPHFEVMDQVASSYGKFLSTMVHKA